MKTWNTTANNLPEENARVYFIPSSGNEFIGKFEGGKFVRLNLAGDVIGKYTSSVVKEWAYYR